MPALARSYWKALRWPPSFNVSIRSMKRYQTIHVTSLKFTAGVGDWKWTHVYFVVETCDWGSVPELLLMSVPERKLIFLPCWKSNLGKVRARGDSATAPQLWTNKICYQGLVARDYGVHEVGDTVCVVQHVLVYRYDPETKSSRRSNSHYHT